MTWLSIVLQVLMSLPNLISDIENLMALIKGKPKATQDAAKQVVMAAMQTQDPSAIQSAITAASQMT